MSLFYVTKMINLGDIKNKNNKEHKMKLNRIELNNNWPYIPDHSSRVLIIDGSGSGKANVLLSLKSK